MSGVRRVTTRIEAADGLALTCDVVGASSDRAPIVLLHGGGQTRHSWAGAAERLAERGHECWVPDLRGHGDSDWAPDGDYGMETMVSDLEAVLAHVGRRPVLVGASMGGMIGLVSEGRLRPGRLRALVLVDIATQLEEQGVERIVSFMNGAPDGFASLEDAAGAIAAYRNRPVPTNLDGLRKNLRLRNGRWYWHWDPAFLSGTSRHQRSDPGSLADAARSLRLPTLLVRGGMSDMVSPEGAQAFLEQCPHARFVDIAEAGHMVVGDRNDAFTDAVVEFIDDDWSEEDAAC